MDQFYTNIYMEVIYRWLVLNKEQYIKNNITFEIDKNDSYKLLFSHHGFKGTLQLYKDDHIIEEIIQDEKEELLFYLHYHVVNLHSTMKFLSDFFYELYGDFDYKHIGISGSSGMTSSLFVEELQKINDLLHLPYKFDVVIESEIEQKYEYFDLILLPPQSAHLEPYFKDVCEDKCRVENIDATVFATDNYQQLLDTIKEMFKK